MHSMLRFENTHTPYFVLKMIQRVLIVHRMMHNDLNVIMHIVLHSENDSKGIDHLQNDA